MPLPAFCQNSLNQVSPKFNNAKVSGFTAPVNHSSFMECCRVSYAIPYWLLHSHGVSCTNKRWPCKTNLCRSMIIYYMYVHINNKYHSVIYYMWLVKMCLIILLASLSKLMIFSVLSASILTMPSSWSMLISAPVEFFSIPLRILTYKKTQHTCIT